MNLVMNERYKLTGAVGSFQISNKGEYRDGVGKSGKIA